MRGYTADKAAVKKLEVGAPEPLPGMAALAALKQLAVLHLDFCELNANHQLISAIQALPLLVELSLCGTKGLQNAGPQFRYIWLQRLLLACAQLTALDLGARTLMLRKFCCSET